MELMNAKQCASYLQIGTQKLYQMRAEHKIPYIKVGESVRFNKEEIDAWLKENTTQPKTRGN